MIYADTSFLFALYQRGDAFHASAKKLMARHKEPIVLTLLGELELLNNLHRGLANRVINQDEHDAIMRQIAEDEADGILVRRGIDQTELYARARNLSKKYTPEISARSLDILHVASAQILKPTYFVSFDAKQRLLAGKTGMTVLPSAVGGK